MGFPFSPEIPLQRTYPKDKGGGQGRGGGGGLCTPPPQPSCAQTQQVWGEDAQWLRARARGGSGQGGGVWLGGCTDQGPPKPAIPVRGAGLRGSRLGQVLGFRDPWSPSAPRQPCGGPRGHITLYTGPCSACCWPGTPGGFGIPLCPFPGVNQPALGMRRGSNRTQAGSPQPCLGQSRRARQGVHPQGLSFPLSLNLVTERSPEAWQGPAGTAGSSGTPGSLQTGIPLHTWHAHPAASRTPAAPARRSDGLAAPAHPSGMGW